MPNFLKSLNQLQAKFFIASLMYIANIQMV